MLPIGTSSAEAEALSRQWEAELYATASGVRVPVVTIGQCVRQHISDKNTEWKDAKARVKTLQKWIAEYEDQDALDLHEWSKRFTEYLRSTKGRNGKLKRPLSNGTIKNIFICLRAAIKYSHKIGILSEDQTARIVIPTVSNDRHHYPQRREMLAIAKACENREVRAAIRIAFYSGMRREEILICKITEKGFLLSPEQTKNGRPRLIPIHPRIAVLARSVKFDISGNYFSVCWSMARKIAGFPDTRFHDLRHGAASEMINSGVDIFTVGSVLGHLSMASTRRYSHLLTDKLSDAVSKIGKKK